MCTPAKRYAGLPSLVNNGYHGQKSQDVIDWTVILAKTAECYPQKGDLMEPVKGEKGIECVGAWALEGLTRDSLEMEGWEDIPSTCVRYFVHVSWSACDSFPATLATRLELNVVFPLLGDDQRKSLPLKSKCLDCLKNQGLVTQGLCMWLIEENRYHRDF